MNGSGHDWPDPVRLIILLSAELSPSAGPSMADFQIPIESTSGSLFRRSCKEMSTGLISPQRQEVPAGVSSAREEGLPLVPVLWTAIHAIQATSPSLISPDPRFATAVPDFHIPSTPHLNPPLCSPPRHFCRPESLSCAQGAIVTSSQWDQLFTLLRRLITGIWRSELRAVGRVPASPFL